MKQMYPLEGKGVFQYDGAKPIQVTHLRKVMAANQIFQKGDIKWYDRFNRFGFISPYNQEKMLREYLFFTKPDLNLFDKNGQFSENFVDTNLTKKQKKKNHDSEIVLPPIFQDAYDRHTLSMYQLCSTYSPQGYQKSPFMNLLTNTVSSNLDLPGVTSETQETTSNIYGNKITIRGSSIKSDYGYDFTLQFKDSAYLEVYWIAKIYDEYMRRIKTGEFAPYKKYIINNIVSDQFSIYKFIVGMDGETIMYFAKLTGVFFTDVPRAEFGDPSDFGKFSLSFHAQDVEADNPLIIADFRKLTQPYIGSKSIVKPYDNPNNLINNLWVKVPTIELAYAKTDARARRRAPEGSLNYYDYRLVWYN